jgi:hypothetical protein
MGASIILHQQVAPGALKVPYGLVDAILLVGSSHLGPPCPNLLRPAGGPPLKRSVHLSPYHFEN